MQDSQTLAITAESSNPNDDARDIELNGPSVRLEALGPMVVNEDGTMSRITNWHAMNEYERVRQHT